MKGKEQNARRNSPKNGIKVVYISSPMKVKTCASKFRALVQELTGKDSEAATAKAFVNDANKNTGGLDGRSGELRQPMCSESRFDGALVPHIEDSFRGMFIQVYKNLLRWMG
ncbi:hypothetical protein SLEP1_g5257 [Rubroshorea leprosula]|uniref:VQ domain-containing protein n=1 Tax=Rubroshorea leprosula TaxID=152421 RepID=A0AAV5HRD5_9ROSI|nr:hypothetical protein SLEP1_g5257 [Rubroshorea leprosula]